MHFLLFARKNRCFSAALFLAERPHHFNSAQITLVKIVFWSVYSFVLNYRVSGYFVLSSGNARPGIVPRRVSMARKLARVGSSHGASVAGAPSSGVPRPSARAQRAGAQPARAAEEDVAHRRRMKLLSPQMLRTKR